MSGYHPDIGLYELTATTADHYLRGPRDASIRGSGMSYVAEVLRRAGYAVPVVASGHLWVEARQNEIWTALSGLPADPTHAESVALAGREALRAGWDAAYSPTVLGLLTEPRVSAAAINKALAAAGLQARVDGAWQPTTAGHDLATGVAHSRGYGRPAGMTWHWRRGVLRTLPGIVARPLPSEA